MKPLKKVSTKWSPELAYAIGLIASDGSLSKDGRHIAFVSKDKDQIIAFKKCLNLKTKTAARIDKDTGETMCFQTQFGDIHFYNWLLSIGLTPNKSKTINTLNIPDKYLRDFLRGDFDGDGYFYSFKDKRWPNSYMFYTNFISASMPHIKWLRERINKKWHISGHIVNIKRAWILRFAKKESRILIPKMYYSAGLPSLKRKKVKIEKCIDVP
ncbi:MAG: hypothetical protein QGG82_02440 [Patescibacteria group bacterium]|jgi:hypothetical protein|nr:hypothetical protein [Patescibacteria group bacterium]|tara:strand:- start:3463 stop:4098 length:636 start_codon:yes stop_codon:yes gene_type:complete